MKKIVIVAIIFLLIPSFSYSQEPDLPYSIEKTLWFAISLNGVFGFYGFHEGTIYLLESMDGPLYYADDGFYVDYPFVGFFSYNKGYMKGILFTPPGVGYSTLFGIFQPTLLFRVDNYWTPFVTSEKQ